LIFLIINSIDNKYIHQTPPTYQDRREHLIGPLCYLRAVVSKAKAMQQIKSLTRDRDIFSQTINLSDLFHSDTFLNVLR
jgi:dynein heavy chain 2